MMVGEGRLMGYDIPGEKNYDEKIQATLLAEMKRTGKGFASSDDIDVDLDWADP